MKYTISINQKVLAESTMDLLDCAILDWIKAMCNSTSKKIIEQRIDGWTWIDYGQLLRDVPLLRIKSKGAITPRIKRIVENGYIETELKDGEKLFVKLTEKVDKLEFDTVHGTKQYRSRTRMPTVHENEPIILLTNQDTKSDTSGETPQDESKEKNKAVAAVIKAFEEVNANAKNFYARPPQRKAVERLIKSFGETTVLQVVAILRKTNSMPYMPTITTPVQLEDKWAQLESSLTKLKAKKTEQKRPVFL